MKTKKVEKSQIQRKITEEYDSPVVALPLAYINNGSNVVLLTGKENIICDGCGESGGTEFSLVLPNSRMFPLRVLLSVDNAIPELTDEIIREKSKNGEYMYAQLEEAALVIETDNPQIRLNQVEAFHLMLAKSIELV